MRASQTPSPATPAKVATDTYAATKNPAITGTKRSGKTLTANAGTYSPEPAKVSYRWLANGKPVKGATASTLRINTMLA